MIAEYLFYIFNDVTECLFFAYLMMSEYYPKPSSHREIQSYLLILQFLFLDIMCHL